MRRSRLPKAQPKISDSGRKPGLSQPSKQPPTAENNEKKTENVIVNIPKSNDNEVESDGAQPLLPCEETVLPEVVIHETDTSTCSVVDATATVVPSIAKAPETNSEAREATETQVSQEKTKEKRHYRKRNQPPPSPDKMRVMDFIFHNPATNPMPKPTERVERQEVDLSEPLEEEETVDEPDNAGEEETEDQCGPRVTLNEFGEIVIDESSLVIPRTQTEDLSKKKAIYETSETTYKSFRKSKVTRKTWSEKDTKKFYKALSIVGTDFTLMEGMFPEKTRTDLKNKYKREERVNRNLLDRVLGEWQRFDVEDLDEYLKDPLDSADASVENEKSKGKEKRVRSGSRKSRPAKNSDGAQDSEKIVGKRTKKPRAKKRHVWDDNEDDVEDASDKVSCEQCALTTRTTKRQRALGEKGLIRICEHHCNESVAEPKTSGVSKIRQRKKGNDKTVVSSADSVQLQNQYIISGRTLEMQDNQAANPVFSTALRFPLLTIPAQNRAFETPERIDKSHTGSPALGSGHVTVVQSGPIAITAANLPSFVVAGKDVIASTSQAGRPEGRLMVIQTTNNELSSQGTNPASNVASRLPFLTIPVQKRTFETPERTDKSVTRDPSFGSARVTAIQSHPTAVEINKSPSLLVAGKGGISSTSQAGRLVVVAGKTPNSNKQVLHVYLVSPSNQAPSTSTQSTNSPLKLLLSSPSKAELMWRRQC